MWIAIHMGVVPVCYRCSTLGTPSYYRQITVAVPWRQREEDSPKPRFANGTYEPRYAQVVGNQRSSLEVRGVGVTEATDLHGPDWSYPLQAIPITARLVRNRKRWRRLLAGSARCFLQQS
jgi:hypothetical protein